jgi:hypothetical protein
LVVDSGTKGLTRLIAPIPAPTLEQIESICLSQDNLSSIVTPRHEYLLILGTSLLLIKIGLPDTLLLLTLYCLERLLSNFLITQSKFSSLPGFPNECT